jgi:hypothetical protein
MEIIVNKQLAKIISYINDGIFISTIICLILSTIYYEFNISQFKWFYDNFNKIVLIMLSSELLTSNIRIAILKKIIRRNFKLRKEDVNKLTDIKNM